MTSSATSRSPARADPPSPSAAAAAVRAVGASARRTGRRRRRRDAGSVEAAPSPRRRRAAPPSRRPGRARRPPRVPSRTAIASNSARRSISCVRQSGIRARCSPMTWSANRYSSSRARWTASPRERISSVPSSSSGGSPPLTSIRARSLASSSAPTLRCAASATSSLSTRAWCCSRCSDSSKISSASTSREPAGPLDGVRVTGLQVLEVEAVTPESNLRRHARSLRLASTVADDQPLDVRGWRMRALTARARSRALGRDRHPARRACRRGRRSVPVVPPPVGPRRRRASSRPGAAGRPPADGAAGSITDTSRQLTLTTTRRTAAGARRYGGAGCSTASRARSR